MKILYFAWLRQRVGRSEESVDVPKDVDTVGKLIDWLKARDEVYAHAFSDLRIVRAAVNQTLASFETPLSGAREVAFFPPVTGG